MKKLLIVFFASFWLSACGAAGVGSSPPKLDVKVGGKDSTLNARTSAVYQSGMAFTAPGKPTILTSLCELYIANFEMETTGPAWMNKPLTAPDQMRVFIQLTGEDGTNEKSPCKAGTYNTQAQNVNGVRVVAIVTFADGKQTETRFTSLMGSGEKKAAGEVKITSVTADAVSGEVNLTEGDKSIKGTFTSTVPRPK